MNCHWPTLERVSIHEFDFTLFLSRSSHLPLRKQHRSVLLRSRDTDTRLLSPVGSAREEVLLTGTLSKALLVTEHMPDTPRDD
jgi:hypothetical protein